MTREEFETVINVAEVFLEQRQPLEGEEAALQACQRFAEEWRKHDEEATAYELGFVESNPDSRE